MLMAPMDLPYVGRCALLQDPQGAIFMALQRGAAPAKPAAKVASKNGVNPNFGMNMPMMSSAFDTAMWLNAA